MNKKQIRIQFRMAVFERDGYQCRKCGCPGKDRQGGDGWTKFHKIEPDAFLDAHHISPRELMPAGGYSIFNGISLCDGCHVKAEQYLQGVIVTGFAPNDLFELIGSSLDEAFKNCSQ